MGGSRGMRAFTEPLQELEEFQKIQQALQKQSIRVTGCIDAIVAAGTSFWTDAELSRLQADVIVNDRSVLLPDRSYRNQPVPAHSRRSSS